jgi:predicted nucleic acid-binding protein
VEAISALATGREPWGLPVFVMGEFLRVLTHPGILRPPSKPARVIQALESIMASPTVHVLLPGDRFWTLLRDTVTTGAAHGNQVQDAEIVAVCREHGVDTILTEDRDLLRFPSIRVRTLTG